MTMRGAAVDDLLAYIFDRRPHALRPMMMEWIISSRRFAQFADTYRDKIRKKLRGAHAWEAVRDVQAELETAYRLLEVRRFEVAYEKYGVGKARCPDLTVTFRSHVVFNVEVTRMRAAPATPSATTSTVQQDLEPASAEADRLAGRLSEVVCAKLGQMPPGMMNLLWVVTDGAIADKLDVAGAMKDLKTRAEGKDATLYARHGFRDTSDFFKRYLQLSGIVLLATGGSLAPPATLWFNSQARHPIPPTIRALLVRQA